ncbi:MAG: choice-of-anchor Q domain-containing protein [Methylovulum sp.]|nr:choice-of-anchor Q domain-containing protein [Methylovulum sp.]
MATQIPPFPFRRHALVLALASAVGTAQAIDINVDGTQCTLINAINNANADADTDGTPGGCPAGSGADTLNLKANKNYVLNTVDNQGAGPNGLPTITSVITINGNGITIKRSHAVGTPSFRLLHVAGNGGNLILNDVNLTGGRLTGNQQYGGAILNEGRLTLNNTKVSGSSSLDAAGGIANTYQSRLTLNDSTVSGNKAPQGGGIVNFQAATAAINNSTVSDNIATNGDFAGIGNGGTMTLVNSTVSGNRSQSSWGTGGIANSGELKLIHTTVSNNRIEVGSVAGVSSSGTLTLINSIVANSKNGSDCYTNTNYGGKTVFQGQSVIEDGTCQAPLSGDPKLSPLLDNGGSTQTHALRRGSIAANIATKRCESFDQRHVIRPESANGICDIGAFEQMAITPRNIRGLITFFDAQVASGGIVGVGANAASKPGAIRNQLLVAGTLKTAQACSQLLTTLKYLDTDNSPVKNDYVTGGQVAELSSQINALRSGCK